MDAAIAGLIGAILGALASLAGTLIAHWLQAKSEQRRWVLNKKEEAYSNSVRAILRVLNKRGRLVSSIPPTLSIFKTEPKSWNSYADAKTEIVHDVGDIQFWLTQLTIYAAKEQNKKIANVLNQINEKVSHIVLYRKSSEAQGKIVEQIYKSQNSTPEIALIDLIVDAHIIVTKCAQEEISIATRSKIF